MPHEDEIAALAATPVILQRLLIGPGERRPAGSEGWTAKEVVAHLRDTEDYRLRRCQRMRDEELPSLESFDQEELARKRDYASTDLAAGLAAFASLRRSVVDLLAALDDMGWQRTAQHEELGLITIESHIRHAISHDLVHLRQIAESSGIEEQNA
jgi:DinB family protein